MARRILVMQTPLTRQQSQNTNPVAVTSLQMLDFQGVIYHLHLLWKTKYFSKSNFGFIIQGLVKYTPGPRVVCAAHEAVIAFRNAWGRGELTTRNCNFNVPKILFGTQWSSLIYTLCTFVSQREPSSLNRTAQSLQSLGLSLPSHISLQLVSLLLLSYGQTFSLWETCTRQGAEVCVPFHSMQEWRRNC